VYIENKTALEDHLFSYQINASDPDNDVMSYFHDVSSSNFSISIAGSSPKLTFRSWYITETSTNYDKKLVQISTNGGTTWTQLAQISDVPSKWNPETIDLSVYTGQTVKFRFVFDTIDAYQNSYEGWYIDDVNITC